MDLKKDDCRMHRRSSNFIVPWKLNNASASRISDWLCSKLGSSPTASLPEPMPGGCCLTAPATLPWAEQEMHNTAIIFFFLWHQTGSCASKGHRGCGVCCLSLYVDYSPDHSFAVWWHNVTFEEEKTRIGCYGVLYSTYYIMCFRTKILGLLKH